MTAGSFDPDMLAGELATVVRAGAKPSLLIRSSLPTLFSLSRLQTTETTRKPVDDAFAVVDVLREAIDQLGDGPQGEAARVLFGLDPGASDLRLQHRRDRAALLLDSQAIRPWDSFRKGPEKRLLQRVAEEIYRLETRRPTEAADATGTAEPSRLRGGADPEAPSLPVGHEPAGVGLWGTKTSTSPVFVGRNRELRLLLGGLEQAMSGRGSLYLLEGDAGIGKTQLARELEGRAVARGARVLWAGCREDPGAPAYGPWIHVLTEYVRSYDRTSLASHLGASGAEIARLVPEADLELADLPVPVPGEMDSGRVRQFDSVISVLKKAARDVPLVIVLDDLHAASLASLRLLEGLASELHNASILVVGTYRAIEASSVLLTLEAVTDLASAGQRIPLGGLAPHELRELLTDIAGSPLPEAFAAEVQRATEGNPLFARELAQLALRDGRVDEDQFVAGTLTVPDTVRQVIRRRLQPLSTEVRELLSIASHVGREFGVHLLGAVCAHGAEECMDLLVAAVELRILVEVPGSLGHYRFTHGLYCEVLRDELAPTKKLRLHERIGTVIEEVHAANLEPHLAELAYHFREAARSGAWDKAAEYDRRAGERATRLLAFEEAAFHYRRALEALEELGGCDEQFRGELYLALGQAEWWSGNREAARSALRKAAGSARTCGNPILFAWAAFHFGEATDFPGRVDAETTDLLEEALARLPAGEGELRVRLLGQLASSLVWDPEAGPRRDTLSREAVAAARQIGDRATVARALIARHAAMGSPDALDERLSATREAMTIARDTGNPEVELYALMNHCSNLLEQGGPRAADRYMTRFRSMAEESRQAFFICTAKVHSVLRALFVGNLPEALVLAREARAFGERGTEPETAAQFHATHTLIVARETGELERLVALTEKFVADNPSLPAWQGGLAWVYVHTGRLEEARREFEELARDEFRGIPRDVLWMSSLATLSEVAALLEDGPRAGALYRLLLPYASRHAVVAGCAASLGSVSMYLGILAGTTLRFDEAAGHFRAALAAHEPESPLWAARTRYHHASALLRDPAGDHDLGLSMLDEAIRSARVLGMSELIESANRLMARA